MMYNLYFYSAALLLLPLASANPVGARAAAETVTRTRTVTGTGAAAAATPAGGAAYDWSEGWTKAFPIHQSCNATLRAQLEEALDETVRLAAHARDHLVRFGNGSDFVQKYFGNGSTAAPVGWFERVVSADKTGMTFRCDDPDENCATQDGWAGHWRGENATLETVICPLSFAVRRPLSAVCGLGYTVAASKLNTFWATDLLHRVLHVPLVSEGAVGHHAEDYAGVLALARNNASLSAVDSDTLQYFAVDVWAYDVAAPGVGCSGEVEEGAAGETAAATATATATATAESNASTTESAAKECHTHDNGELHCV